MQDIKQVNLTMYSEESFKECFPERPSSYYEEHIDIPISEQLKKLEKGLKCRIQNLRLVPISDFYFEFIEDEGLENTHEMRTEFVNEVDDELAQLLWDSSAIGRVPSIYTMIIKIISPTCDIQGNIKLDTKLLKNIHNILREHYDVDKEDVFCLNTLYRPDYLDVIQEQVTENCLRGLCGEKLIQFDNSELDRMLDEHIKSQYQKYKDEDIDKSSLCIQNRLLVFAVFEKTRFQLTRKQALEDDIFIADYTLSSELDKKLAKNLDNFFMSNDSIKESYVIPQMIPIDFVRPVIEDLQAELSEVLIQI